MIRIALHVSYDGTHYSGWQRQLNAPSVQQQIEQALYKATGEHITIMGASRTDKGVHALGQVAHFDTQSSIPPEKYPFVLNALLPDDIRVSFSQQVHPLFHARFHTKGKIYTYRIHNAPHANALNRLTHAHVPVKLDADKMHAAVQCLVGQHDFAAYAASGGTHKSSIREIYTLGFVRSGETITFTIHGNAFLYNMVRIIVGTAIDVSLSKRDADCFSRALNSLDRLDLGITAPAHGLELTRVYYDEDALIQF